MAISSLAKKLKIKSGEQIAVINSPEDYINELGTLPEGVELATELKGKFDFVHIFVQDSTELERLFPSALGALKDESALWVSYPKKSSNVQTDLTRDQGWDVTTKLGQRPVSMISINPVWSAVRFRKSEGGTEQDVVRAQYAGGKSALKAIYDRLVQVARDFGSDVELAPRKTYVGLVRKRIFGVIQPSTKTRIDLGLKLKNKAGNDRLIEAPGFGSGSITHKIALISLEDVDSELVGWIKEAYDGVE